MQQEVLIDAVTIIRGAKASKKQKQEEDTTLPILVFASHVRGLECWHALIRTHYLPFEIDCILHVDSHPDLMLPSGAFSGESTPELYAQLEQSMGGIAEWLLPAFFMGHCKEVIWLKPYWSTQLPLGHVRFSIGQHVTNHQLYVTCTEPYFKDIYAPESELVDVKTIDLFVVEDDQKKEIQTRLAGKKWMLDVCLDYFAVLNPFLVLAAAKVGWDLALQVKEGFVAMQNSCGEIDDDERWRNLCRPLFQEVQGVDDVFQQGLLSNAFINACKLAGEKGGTNECLALIEFCKLPHHPEIHGLESFATLCFLLKATPPLACLIARSDEDEYTPKLVCDELESFVIRTAQTSWPQHTACVLQMEQFELV